MAIPEKKTNIIGRALHGTDKIFSKVMAFICGIFVSAIFFLIMLKLLNSWGICLALGLSGAFNIWCKKKYKKVALLNMFNNGAITFNIFTAIILVAMIATLFGAVQSALQ